MQVPPRGPVDPVLQVQLVKDALPAGELEIDGQALHVEAPTAAEYIPAAQSEQVAVPVDALYFPAAHDVHENPLENPAKKLFNLDEASVKTASGRCVFQTYTFDSCQSLFSDHPWLMARRQFPAPPAAVDLTTPLMILPADPAVRMFLPHATTQLVLGVTQFDSYPLPPSS